MTGWGGEGGECMLEGSRCIFQQALIAILHHHPPLIPPLPSIMPSSSHDSSVTVPRPIQKSSIASLLEQIKEGDSVPSPASRGSAPLKQGLRGKAVAAPVKQQNAKYRKDSVDIDSLRTRELYQAKQAERIRVAFKEGKRREVLVKSTTRLAEAATWDVPCNAEFYDGAYGVVRGCTPSVMQCSRIVHDGFGR